MDASTNKLEILNTNVINYICSFLPYIDILCWKIASKYVNSQVAEYYSAKSFIKRYITRIHNGNENYNLLFDMDRMFKYGQGFIYALLQQNYDNSSTISDIFIGNLKSCSPEYKEKVINKLKNSAGGDNLQKLLDNDNAYLYDITFNVKDMQVYAKLGYVNADISFRQMFKKIAIAREKYQLALYNGHLLIDEYILRLLIKRKITAEMIEKLYFISLSEDISPYLQSLDKDEIDEELLILKYYYTIWHQDVTIADLMSCRDTKIIKIEYELSRNILVTEVSDLFKLICDKYDYCIKFV